MLHILKIASGVYYLALAAEKIVTLFRKTRKRKRTRKSK